MMMSGYKHRLKAYLGQQCIGTLDLLEDNTLHFVYEAHWQQSGYPLSPHLPLDNSAATHQFTLRVFLQNLFPEGENLEVLLQTFHLSRYNIFGMTRALGFDLPGALQLIPEDSPISHESIFRPITDSEIIERLSYYEPRNLIIWDNKPRLSLAGVHQKINVLFNEKGEMGFGDGKLFSTHILKFQREPKQRLVLNEYLMMNLAKLIDLNVAEVKLKPYHEFLTLLVTRFDRANVHQQLYRRHMIDGCQALNLLPEYKYERNLGSGRDVRDIREGAHLPDLFSFCDTCFNPAMAKKQLLEWTLFNLMIGNWDAHAKNLSYFVSAHGLELTPMYDLINIRVYPEYAQELAMALGDEFEASRIYAYQLADFAESCGLSRVVVAQTLNQMCQKVLSKLPELKRLSAQSDFIDTLIADIAKEAEHLKIQSGLVTSINL